MSPSLPIKMEAPGKLPTPPHPTPHQTSTKVSLNALSTGSTGATFLCLFAPRQTRRFVPMEWLWIVFQPHSH